MEETSTQPVPESTPVETIQKELVVEQLEDMKMIADQQRSNMSEKRGKGRLKRVAHPQPVTLVTDVVPEPQLEFVPSISSTSSSPVGIPTCLTKDESEQQQQSQLHTPAKRWPVRCNMCDRNFANSSNLRRHVDRIHKGQTMRFLCQHCELGFYTKSELSEHTMRHFDTKRYLCEVCGYSALTRKEIASHSLRHSTERPHRCDLCYFAARHRCQLNAHVASAHAADVAASICSRCGVQYAEEKIPRHNCLTMRRKLLQIAESAGNNNLMPMSESDPIFANVLELNS